jgi:uncharacterized protein (TIGR02996 family)
VTEDQAFLRAIRASPGDLSPRLVYADWLEERGDVRGEFLRVQAQAALHAPAARGFRALKARERQLRDRCPPDWLARLAPLAWIDVTHPANGSVLRSLVRGQKVTGKSVRAPESVRDPYVNCGSHPDVVERVWDQLGRVLPRDGRCLLSSHPALVHPASGVVLAVCYGTEYCLRVAPQAEEEARQVGAETVSHWSDGGRTPLRTAFGGGWIFGLWVVREKAWCRAVYAAFDPPG